MEIKELKKDPSISQDKKLRVVYAQLNKLLKELNKKKLPDAMVISINHEIDKINAISDSDQVLRKQIKKSQTRILRLIEKGLKLVTKNHYRNTWMVLGIAVFGIPFGTTFGTSLGNMGFLPIGVSMGMAIGLALGSGMDKKAFNEGRQLDLEI